MPQTPIDNTQPSLALTQAFVTVGVKPQQGQVAGGAFLDEIFTFPYNFAPGGTVSANGQLLPIAQNTDIYSLIGTTYGGNGTTNFAIPNLGGVTMIGTGQGPGLSPEQLGALDDASSVTLTRPELPPDLGGTSQLFSNYQPSLPVTYMICVAGTFPSQGGGVAVQDMIGEVMPFAGNFVPTDYLPADGRLLQINQSQQNKTLFNVIGTTYGGDGVNTFALPDLRGRTIISASTVDPVGTLLGSPTASLSNNQTPNGFTNTAQPFDEREPSLALNYLIALNGTFPNHDTGSVNPNTPYLAEIIPFAGNFVPSGWALCNGQLLPINQNQALFSLLGTTFGGNGTINFALPDLRDRTVIGTSASVSVGSLLGATSHTVTAAELPTGPNPMPPAGTTAAMILRGSNTSALAGQYEIYNISNNTISTSYSLGQVGTDWQFVGLGGFNGTDTTDMILRNSNTAGLEVYDISNNNITNAAFLGAIGLEWQLMGFGNFSSLGETDMMLRNMNTGGIEVCDIRNNQVTSVPFIGTVGLNWQFSGLGNFSGAGESDMLLRNSNTGGLEVYDIANNQITGAAFIGTVGVDWKFSGVGNFSGVPGESDLLLRSSTTGGLEVYDIANNQLTGAAFLGTVGLDWQFAGVAPVHGPGASDLVLRNVNTGQFELYDIANDQITGAAPLGSVVMDWQLGGFAADPAAASMGGEGSTSQLVQAMAGFGGGSGAAENLSAASLGAETSQQPLLTTPRHA
jgi:microcystin-dependent protein